MKKKNRPHRRGELREHGARGRKLISKTNKKLRIQASHLRTVTLGQRKAMRAEFCFVLGANPLARLV